VDVRFVGLTARIPDDWEDRSTITFQIPPDPAMAAPLAGEKVAARSPGNVVIQWGAAGSAPDPARQHIEGQLRALPAILAGFSTADRGDLGDPSDAIPFIEYIFEAGGQQLQQILAARRIGDRVVSITGTALSARFRAHRTRFIEIARSVRASPP
jgi:hypothetical protein